MVSENLESTCLSNSEIDQYCKFAVENQDLSTIDTIDDSALLENILTQDQFNMMDLSTINSELSFEDEFSNQIESLT